MARTRSRGKQLLSLLASSSSPVYAVDDRRKIVYCNEACTAWLGVDAEVLLGQRCDYHSGDVSADELATTLCPPPEAFAGRYVTAHLICPSAAGRTSRRRASFCPLGGTGLESTGVLAVVSHDDDLPAQAAERPSTAAELHDRLRMLVQHVRGQYRLDRLVGESPAIGRVREQVRLATAGRARVVVVGPPGSGREHVARSIHGMARPDAAGPLMPLSSGSLDAELLQTTILAFLGRCREADSMGSAAVLLLDVDQLSLAGQAELLAFFRVPTFALRTLVTARRSLLELAEQGKFDRELALALSTLVIELPALASRRRDIPALAQQLVEQFNAAGNKQLSGFTDEALDRLGALPWTGDVDELAEVVQQACRVAAGPWIEEADLPKRVDLIKSAAAHPVYADETIALDDFLLEIERELVQRAMRRAKGNKAQAARLLGIHRARLLRRLTQLGLDGEA